MCVRQLAQLDRQRTALIDGVDEPSVSPIVPTCLSPAHTMHNAEVKLIVYQPAELAFMNPLASAKRKAPTSSLSRAFLDNSKTPVIFCVRPARRDVCCREGWPAESIVPGWCSRLTVLTRLGRGTGGPWGRVTVPGPLNARSTSRAAASLKTEASERQGPPPLNPRGHATMPQTGVRAKTPIKRSKPISWWLGPQ